MTSTTASLSRRGFFTGLAATALATPAIIKVSSIMRISPQKLVLGPMTATEVLERQSMSSAEWLRLQYVYQKIILEPWQARLIDALEKNYLSLPASLQRIS